jgi:hypothetical protein
MNEKSMNNGNSFANGNAPDVVRKTQRDSGFAIRPESSWTLSGVVPSGV